MADKVAGVLDLDTLRDAKPAEETIIKFSGPIGATNLECMTENVDASQLWAASRILQLLGDDVFRSQMRAMGAQNGRNPN